MDSSRITAPGVVISPYFEAGSYIERENGAITTYEIWVNSMRQTTPNTSRQGVDFNFRGIYPRVETEVNRDPRAEYDVVTWETFRQGAASITVHPHPEDRCG